jgi:23S rRNA pseudouridine1911/1915/1917 synthase
VRTEDEPQDIPLDVLMEHEEFLIINKVAGLVVHPAAGNWKGTLVNALLHRYPELERLPRAGIVHRLDKDTSGCLLVARTPISYHWYVQSLKDRLISRQYLAVVQGVMIGGGTLDAPIGRSPRDRKKMAVVDAGKPAITHYRVREKFTAHTLVEVHLETGRTHQIRVHMAHKRFPLVGDSVYGSRILLPKGCTDALRVQLQTFPRQALHAEKLSFETHKENMEISCECPIPADIEELLTALRNFSMG